MKNKYIETSLETEMGTFNIRVYKAKQGQETVVLYTKQIDPSLPVLTRIHSECLTGDIFQSLRCDCGQQLKKSLRLIDESKNGVLIYLRQEGRGIGLFEKIKTYQLQHRGYDTYQANVILGHKPDSRTYECANKALNDLGIEKINLVTNNPSKIREVRKSGIKVIDRIALNIKPNHYNQRYFTTKQCKFKHFV